MRGHRAASGDGGKLRERQRRQSEIGADHGGRREHRERILHQMAARRADLVGNFGAENVCGDRRAVGMQRVFDQPRIGFRVLAERDDAADAGFPGAAREMAELRIVAVEDRGAVAFEAEKDFRLGVGDLGQRAEEFEMHRRDGGDDGDVRARQSRQRLDLAGVVHPHFQHGVLRVRRTARERQRHAPMIVVGRDRRMGLAVFGEREPQRFLGAGFADRAGDADHLRRRARPRRGGERAQRLEHVGHDQKRRVRRQLRAPVRRDHRESGLGRERRAHELMAVAAVAGEGEERFARRDGAGIDREPGDRRRQRALALGAHRRRHAVDGPQRHPAHAASSSRAAATAW